MKRLILLFAFCVPLIFGSGCGPSYEPIVGGTVRIPIQTIVSLSPSTTEIAGRLGATRAIRGRTSACNWPPAVEQIEVVVSGTTPDFERIAEIAPDLILMDNALYGDEVLDQLLEMRMNVLILESNSIGGWADFHYRFGAIMGFEKETNSEVDRVYSMREEARATWQDRSPSATILLAGEGEYMAAGMNTFNRETLEIAGYTPIGPDASSFVVVSAESLVSWNPEFIFTPGGRDQIMADSRLQTVRAVQDGRVYNVNADILLRAGNRVPELIEALYRVGVRSYE